MVHLQDKYGNNLVKAVVYFQDTSWKLYDEVDDCQWEHPGFSKLITELWVAWSATDEEINCLVGLAVEVDRKLKIEEVGEDVESFPPF